jgi:hypothetical protein
MNAIERRQQVRRLWVDGYPEAKRTNNHLVLFHAWLEKNWSELPDPPNGDSFQELKADLMDLWREH